jgi:PAS domain S-box-containing protein
MSADRSFTDLFDDPHLQNLLNSLGEGVVVADDLQRVVYLNPRAEAILGTELSRIKGHGIHACHRCPWKVELALKEFSVDKPYREEVPVKDRWLSITATPIVGADGVRAGATMIISDTTQRRRMEDVVRHQNEELVVRQQRLDFQIDLARQIQKAMMPPDLTRCPGAHIRFWNTPAQAIGGDFALIEPAPWGAWVIMGDIMGKGLVAASFVPLMHSFLQQDLGWSASANLPPDPVEVCARVNTRLCGFLADRFTLFATMILGQFHSADRTYRFVSAGHESPLILRASGQTEVIPTVGYPIGVKADAGFSLLTVSLAPGDRLFMVSDGITDGLPTPPGTDRAAAVREFLHQGTLDPELFDRFMGSAVEGVVDDRTMIEIAGMIEEPNDERSSK